MWKKSEKFEYAGKLVIRTAGKSAGRVMETFVKLRKKSPELFEDFEVYTQPAAVVDGIIQGWMLEEQAASFPCSVWCRDMLAAGHSTNVRLVQALCQQIGTSVKGGVTPLVQLTDTDFSWSFKSSVAAAQMKVREEQKAQAKARGEIPTFKCGFAEIMQIFDAARRAQECRPDWILAAARRNGYLHYRPCYLQMKLKEASLQQWTEDMPEGSYRFPSRWLEERGKWLKVDGKPMKATLEDMEDAERKAITAEAKFCHNEGYTYVVQSLVDKKVKLAEAHAEIGCDELAGGLEMHLANLEDIMDSKIKRRLRKALEQAEQGDEKKPQCLKKKDAERKARFVLLQAGKKKLQQMLKTMTKAEAISSMKLEAGRSKKRSVKPEAKVEKVQKKLLGGKLVKSLKLKYLCLKMAAVKSKKSKPSLKLKPSAKSKPSLTSKPSAKSKPSLKSKPSAEKKKMQKLALKKGGGKWSHLKKVLKKNAEKGKMKYLAFIFEENKKDACEENEEKLAGVEAYLEGMEVVVADEHAGVIHFGKKAVVVEVDCEGGEDERGDALIDFQPGVFRLPLKYLQFTDEKNAFLKLPGLCMSIQL